MQKTTIISIIPLLVFVALFLGSGLYFDNFYSLPAPIIALFSVVVALLIYRAPMKEKIGLFFKGAGDSNVLQMCLIALLAGAFASVANALGSTHSIVNMGMYYISPEYFPVGIFIIASFLSFATGTSVGTIMTLSPIDKTGPHLQFLAEVSLLFKSAEKRQEILNATDKSDIIRILTE